MITHPWSLVGPWYRSESIGGPPANRVTAPIFQKYGDADFMNKFVQEPQKSLKFSCEDFVERLCLDPNAVVTPKLKSKFNDSLKLFLNSHSRFYLVVCELHCVVPGFPSVSRDQVCETGFVVRRKVPVVKKDIQTELAKKQHRVSELRSQVLKMTGKLNNKKEVFSLIDKVKKITFDKTIKELNEKQLAKLQAGLNSAIEELHAFIADNDIHLKLQAWMPTSNDAAIGNWCNAEDAVQTITEKSYPLYPLEADPTADNHSAKGKTMWFGLIPTGSSDVDSNGLPQFDEADLYEIKCFVRRKKDCCKNNGANCCHGELFWSEATASYRLASFFDIDGNSHKPINIKLPDLNALKNQTNLGPPGRGVNVKTIAPARSSLKFSTDGMDMPSVDDNELVRPGQQICFFAILLFFIVAMFLFRLILPIILFLFQLWFLLKLKLCIPPSISLDAGIAVDLEIKGPEIELQFDLSVDGKVEFGGQIFNSKAELKNKLSADIANELGDSGSDFISDLTAKLSDPTNQNGLSLNELADLYISVATDFSENPSEPVLAGKIPLPEDGQKYFTKVSAI